MYEAFIIPFLTIGFLEIGDKTRLIALILTTHYDKPVQIFFGMTLAYALVDGVAVIFGDTIVSLLPFQIVKYVAGAAFIILGLFLLLRRMDEEESEKAAQGSPFLTAFMASLTEFGDKTQIAVGLFSVQYREPLLVFLGAMSALAVLNLIFIFLGKSLVNRVPFDLIKKASAILFVLFGVAAILL